MALKALATSKCTGDTLVMNKTSAFKLNWTTKKEKKDKDQVNVY